MKVTDSRLITRITNDSPREVGANEPFRLGVPLSLGLVRDCRLLRLISGDGEAIAVQAKPLLKWPDGSLKWVLLDWLGGPRDVELTLTGENSELPPPAVDHPVTVVRQAEAVVVPTLSGDYLFRIGDDLGQAFDLVAGTEDGATLTPAIKQIDLIDPGPVRVCIRLNGVFSTVAKHRHLEWMAEGHFFANQSLQRWSLTIRNARAANHHGGIWELGDGGSVLLRDVSIGLRPREVCDEVVLSTDRRADRRSCSSLSIDQVSSGGENWNSTNHVDRDGEVKLSFRGFQLDVDGSTSRGRRADPTVTLRRNGRPALGIYAEKFWQNFPKRLSANDHELVLDLLPRGGDLHELQGGEQKTHAYWIARGDAASERTLGQLRDRIVPRISAEAFAESGVIRFATAISHNENEDYRRLVTQAVEGDSSFFEKREQIDEYGWRHFGDVYGDHEAAFSESGPLLISHWNNQYDLVFGLGLRYLRGGDHRWFELMDDMAWHVSDIDIYHIDDDKLAYNHGLYWHTVHYTDAGRATHRSYPSGSVGGGPSAEHAYARGLMLHYCLTGEAAIRDAAIELADWILALEDGSRTPFRWLSSTPTGLSSASGSPDYHGPGRAPGNATETLLTGFELTGRREFLDRVEELMRRVIHPNDDLEELNLLDAERRWYYNLYLQALGRYLEIKVDLHELDQDYAYGRAALLRYARWMYEHEYPYLEKPEILEFPTETWAAQDMRKSEVFHFASRHADSDERKLFLEKAAFFFDYSVSTLATMNTRGFCRPVALLLGSGYSFDGFRAGTEGAPPPAVSRTDWPDKVPFVAQKPRAMTWAKKVALVSLLFSSVALVGAALVAWRN